MLKLMSRHAQMLHSLVSEPGNCHHTLWMMHSV